MDQWIFSHVVPPYIFRQGAQYLPIQFDPDIVQNMLLPDEVQS